MNTDLQKIIDDCKKRNKELRKMNRNMKWGILVRKIKRYFKLRWI